MLMMITMKDLEQIFFELIRVAIGTQSCLTRKPSASEWKKLYGMAKKQSLVGVCFAGVQRLRKADEANGSHITENLPEMGYVKWMGMAAKIQRSNEKVNRQCVQLTNKFRLDGFDVVVLKGQSCARRYQVRDERLEVIDLSLLRQSGDIDVWLTGSREKIKKYITEKYEVGEVIYNHAHVSVFEDTEVEVHFTPSWLYSPARNRNLQEWFCGFKDHKRADAIRFDFIEQEGFKSPSVEFDLVYLMLHAYRHLLHEGLGLRQVMDYFFVLTLEEEVREKRSEVRETLRALGLLPFAGALLWVINKVFIGHDSNYTALTTNLEINPNEKRGRQLLAEIERGGNMGRGDDRTGNSTSRMGYFWEHMSRQWSFMRDYPSEVLWSPVWKAWHFVMRKSGRI